MPYDGITEEEKPLAKVDFGSGRDYNHDKEETLMSPAIITLLFLLFAIIMFVTEKIPLGLT